MACLLGNVQNPFVFTLAANHLTGRKIFNDGLVFIFVRCDQQSNQILF